MTTLFSLVASVYVETLTLPLLSSKEECTPDVFYVYLHKRLDTGGVFYVGKGKGKRAFSRSNRNRYWINVVNKTNFEVEIVAKNLSEQEALSFEIYLISLLRSKGNKLTNLTSGGEGVAGYVPTKETRLKISKMNTGRECTQKTRDKLSIINTGKKLKDTHKNKIALAHKGKKFSKVTLSKMAKAKKGRLLTEETKKRISEANKGRECSKDSRLKIAESNSDRGVYTFLSECGEVFTGTRAELCKKFRLNAASIQHLFGKSARKKALGWSLLPREVLWGGE